MKCPKCRIWSDDTAYSGDAHAACPHCGVIFENFFRLQAERAKAAALDDETFGGGALEKWAVPGALLVSLLLDQLSFFRLVMVYIATIPFHESGHAWIGVLGSRYVLPLGVILPMAAVTQVGAEPSPFFFTLYLVLFGTGVYFSLKRRFWIGALISLGLIVFLFGFKYSVPESRFMTLLLLGGVGGEIVLGTLGVSAFFLKKDSIPRWDFFRYPVLFLSSFVFVHSFMEWRAIAGHKKGLPVGSFLGDQGDLSGDIDRLISLYGMTEASITSTCVNLSHFGAALIATLFVVQWFQIRKQSRARRLSSLPKPKAKEGSP